MRPSSAHPYLMAGCAVAALIAGLPDLLSALPLLAGFLATHAQETRLALTALRLSLS